MGLRLTPCLIALVLTCICSCANNDVADADQRRDDSLRVLGMQALADSLSLQSAVCLNICSDYDWRWAEAIERGRNVPKAMQPFYDSLQSMGLYDATVTAKRAIDSLVRTVLGPMPIGSTANASNQAAVRSVYSADDDKARDKLIELYGVYSQLYSMVHRPLGSILVFQEKTSSLTLSALRLNHELGALGLVRANRIMDFGVENALDTLLRKAFETGTSKMKADSSR